MNGMLVALLETTAESLGTEDKTKFPQTPFK